MLKLKYYRIKAGLSQCELAEKLNVSRFFIQTLETGKYNSVVKEDVLRRIASELKVNNFFELFEPQYAFRVFPKNDNEIINFVHGLSEIAVSDDLKEKLKNV